MVRETHQDPAVIQALNERFIPIRFEARGHMDLVQQFQVTSAPTTLLFSPDGQEKHRYDGFMAPKEYLQELSKGGLEELVNEAGYSSRDDHAPK